MKQLLLFTADWCNPCQAFKPHFREAKENHKDIEFIEINVDTQREMTVQYKVRGVPTLILAKNGETLAKYVNPSTMENLESIL